MPTYVTPGVYYERADAGVATIAPLRTDIAGFVGIARRGPLDLAIPVESWRQFVAYFGDFTGAGYLAYTVRGFFENGGRRCWVVRVASPAATAASASMDATPAPANLPPFRFPWNVVASSPGVWGNDVEIEWRETHRAQTTADPSLSTPEYVTVGSVTGFERGTLVRALIAPAAPDYRVVTRVDPALRRLHFVNPRVADRLPYERTLTGYDSLRRLAIESIEYTLLVYDLGRLTAVYERISLCRAHPRFGPAMLPLPRDSDEGLPPAMLRFGSTMASAPVDQPGQAAPDSIAIVERTGDVPIALPAPLAPAMLSRRFLAGGLDGLAPLTTRDFLGEAADPFDDIATRRRRRRGVRALEPVDEVAVVAVPDIQIQPAMPPAKRPPPVCVPDPCLPQPPLPPAIPRVASVGDLPPRFTIDQIYEVQQAQIDHCVALHDRFALLDPPLETVGDMRVGIGPLRAWRRRFDSDFAALYAPWLRVPDSLGLDSTGLRAVPACGHVAGFMAQTDVRHGVHQAPANGALSWLQGVTLPVDDALHGILNPEQVNAIRVQNGRGIRILGARTLSSDPDWRFVNVRRLLLMLEKAIRIGIQWATFEPNDRFTRAKLHLSLTSLLLEVWRRGALVGKTAQEAFFVNCTEAENPPDVRERGMLVAEVGVAPAKPLEFIIVRVAVSENSLEITETSRMEALS